MRRSQRPCPKGEGMEGAIEMRWVGMDCIALGAMAMTAMIWHC